MSRSRDGRHWRASWTQPQPHSSLVELRVHFPKVSYRKTRQSYPQGKPTPPTNIKPSYRFWWSVPLLAARGRIYFIMLCNLVAGARSHFLRAFCWKLSCPKDLRSRNTHKSGASVWLARALGGRKAEFSGVESRIARQWWAQQCSQQRAGSGRQVHKGRRPCPWLWETVTRNWESQWSDSSQPGIAGGRLTELLYLSFTAGEPENSEVPGLSVISRVSHLQQGD